MANKLFSTVILCLCAFAMQAQLATVSGRSTMFGNKPVGLYIIDDFITNNSVLVDSTKASADGSFSLKNTVQQPCYGYIKAGELVYDVHLLPGAIISVMIYDTTGSSTDSLFVPIVYNQRSSDYSDDVNVAITRFDNEYNDFLLVHYKAILRKTAQKITEEFIAKLQTGYAGYTNSYFKSYMQYRIAALELSAYLKGEKAIIKQYFNNKPVLYTNPAYMDLFNQVFEGGMKKFVLSAKGQGMLTAINVNANFDKALNLLKQDSTLQNDTLRELYLIKGLGELFYRPGMVKYSLLEMLKYAAEKALTADNKLIAAHLLAKLEKLRPGTPAPAFSLKNIATGQNVSLADFRGKIIYLSFWDENNIPSVQEIDLIKELDKLYGKRITFISIGNYVDEAKTLAFLNRNKYKWVFLNSMGNKQLLSDYEVLSYPAFYLIDAAGNILKYPADKPSGNIGATLEKIYNNK